MADISWGHSTDLPGGWMVVGSGVGRPMIVRTFIPLFTLSPIFEPQQVAAEIRFGANRLNGITAQWGFSDEDDPASPNPIQNGLMLELANMYDMSVTLLMSRVRTASSQSTAFTNACAPLVT